MKIYNKFVESKKEPSNKNDIWFDGSVFNIYKEGKWQVFTLELDAANKVKQIIDNASNVYQEKLTAGKGVIIENNMISTEKFFQIVDKLPTKGENNTIYLIASKNKEDENTLIEYIWLDNRWEKLGEFKAGIDLSLYLKIQDSPFEKGSGTNSAVLKSTYSNTAKGINSVAFGKNVVVNSNNSFGSGLNIIVNCNSGSAFGKANVGNANSIFEVGIGTLEDGRKNAFEVKQNGDIYITGIGGFTGANSSSSKSVQEVINELVDIINQITE